MVTVPNVLGETAGLAVSQLQGAGFSVVQQHRTVSEQASQRRRPCAAGAFRRHDGQEGHHGDHRRRQVHGPDRPAGPTGPTGPSRPDGDHRPDRAPVNPLRVAVLGGGRSSEHDVSLASAARSARGCGPRDIRISTSRSIVTGCGGRDGAEPLAPAWSRARGGRRRLPRSPRTLWGGRHVQGLLECLDVPYVGAGVLALALCMDKVTFKELMARGRHAAGATTAAVSAAEFAAERERRPGLTPLGLPVFVKPARLGSSVGISPGRRGVTSCRGVGGGVCSRLAGDRRGGG